MHVPGWLCVGMAAFSTVSVHAAVVADNFDSAHDYLTQGTAGTIWDGILNADGATTLDADASNPGLLTITSGSNRGWESGNSSATTLYRNVSGDFVATVRRNETTFGNFSVAGIIARVPDLAAADAGEDYITIMYENFPNYIPSPQNTRRVLDNGNQSNSPIDSTPNPWLRLERVGDSFIVSTSADGVSFNNPLSIDRPDLNGITLQVGLWYGTFSNSGATGGGEQTRLNGGTATLDSFTLSGPLVPEPFGAAIFSTLALLSLRRRRDARFTC